MATYFFRNTGDANWGTSTNWSLTDGGGATGAVPTATDAAMLTSNSGSCTTNTSPRVCLSIDFTGYTQTFTMTTNLTVSGSITLSNTMTIAGAATLSQSAAGTLTANGKTWGLPLTLNTANTGRTFADTWTVSSFSTSISALINGGTVNVTTSYINSGSVTSGSTATIVMTGTGSITNTAGTIRNNITINTAGTVTFSGTVTMSNNTLTYTAGTVVTTGSTLLMSASVTLNTAGIIWSTINFGGTTTYTLTSNVSTVNLIFSTGNASVAINGAFTISVSGDFSCNNSAGWNTGGNIILTGTGTWSHSSGGRITGDLTINTAGTITLGSSILINGNTVTYIAGTIVNTGSTLTVTGNPTFVNNTFSWNNIGISATGTVTINSATLTIAGTLDLGQGASAAITFAGTHAWIANTLAVTNTGSGVTHILKIGLTYIITNSFTAQQASNASKTNITSSVASTSAALKLSIEATQDVGYINFTDIDASAGKIIWTYKGTLTRTTNINVLPTDIVYKSLKFGTKILK